MAGMNSESEGTTAIKASDEAPKDSDEASSVQGRHKYPYARLVFLLSAATGQSYAQTGLQAVLELFFVRFLYVCLPKQRGAKLGTTSVNIYIAVYQTCALSAGFLADKVLGNFATQLFSMILSTVGIFLLTFASWQLTLTTPHCCLESNFTDPYYWQALGTQRNCSDLHKVPILEHLNLHMSPTASTVLALIGLMLFSIGYGHMNIIQSVFVADQFEEEKSKAKERSFSWFYLCMNLGNVFGESGMPVIRQSAGFVVAWLTVLGSTLVSAVLFLSGSCVYVKKRPNRLQCRCSRNHSSSVNSQPSEAKHAETTPLLNKPSSHKAQQSSLARLKEFLPFLGVFAPMVVFWAIFYQQNSTWILQGTQMDCYLGKLHVPPDLMPGINDFLVILIIPILDYLVYPHLERTMGIKVRSLHKMVAGMVFASLSFLVSGLLQYYLSDQQRDDCHGDVSIAWQLPQLLLISFAEVLVSVTGLEFAYTQAPPGFRNIVSALWGVTQALGTLLNAAIAQLSISLMAQFFTYMGLMVVVTLLFVVINRRYRYRDSEDSQNTQTDIQT